MEDSQKLQLYEEISSHVTDHVMAGIEEITGQRGEHYIRVTILFLFVRLRFPKDLLYMML
jgi:hypothetical protein